MNVAFEIAFSRILKVEGVEFTNIPEDRGGPTKYGITQQSLIGFRKKVQTVDDVKALTESDAKLFYQEMFWHPLLLDNLTSAPMAVMLFDQAVNRGRGAVVAQAQQVLVSMGLLAVVDGSIGPQTIAALNRADFKKFGFAFFKASQESYVKICQKNPEQTKFLLGWIRRTHGIIEDVLSGGVFTIT